MVLIVVLVLLVVVLMLLIVMLTVVCSVGHGSQRQDSGQSAAVGILPRRRYLLIAHSQTSTAAAQADAGADCAAWMGADTVVLVLCAGAGDTMLLVQDLSNSLDQRWPLQHLQQLHSQVPCLLPGGGDNDGWCLVVLDGDNDGLCFVVVLVLVLLMSLVVLNITDAVGGCQAATAQPQFVMQLAMWLCTSASHTLYGLCAAEREGRALQKELHKQGSKVPLRGCWLMFVG